MIASPLPSLWTPWQRPESIQSRFGPWWRKAKRILPWMFQDFPVYDPITGNPMYSPTQGGYPMTGCVKAAVDCSVCDPDATPKTWTVTISGISNCPCHIRSGQVSGQITTGDGSGTFTLTQFDPFNSCHYQWNGASGATASFYSTALCSGSLLAQGSTGVIDLLLQSGPIASLSYGVFNGPGEISVSGNNVLEVIFFADGPLTSCVSGTTTLNDTQSCAAFPSSKGGIGGVAILTPGP